MARPGSVLRFAVVIASIASLAAVLGGCSTFERDWEALASSGSSASGIEGRWSGTWRSDANGHDGGLRCIITAGDDGAYEARYHATYGALIGFEYTMPMTVTRDGEAHTFSAEADLGWLAGGRYEYEGSIVGDEFRATYVSESDRGVFEMGR